jgi:hypothetical protein
MSDRTPFMLRAAFILAGLVAMAGLVDRPASAAPAAPSPCSAANQKSIKFRANHKLRQARDQAMVCAATTCSAPIRTSCKKRAAALSTAIPTIVFMAKDNAGHDLTDVKVTMDGEALADRLDGTALSVDPGQHTFTFQIEGQSPSDQSFLIVEGQKDRREPITLTVVPPPPPVAEVAAPPVEPGADAGTTGGSRGRGPLKTAAFVLVGVGAASLVAGGVTGGLAIAKWHSAESACESATQCTNHAQAVSDHGTASTFATVSTATLIAGGLALATGVTFLVVAPRREGSSAPQGALLELDPMLGYGLGGMALKGAF